MLLLRLSVLLLDSCASLFFFFVFVLFFMVDVFHFLRQTQKSSALMDGAALQHLVLTQTRLNCGAGKWKIKGRERRRRRRGLMNY